MRLARFILLSLLVPFMADAAPRPKLIKDVLSGPKDTTDEFKVVGDSIYLTVITLGEGKELWRSDGTVQGTRLLKDLVPGKTGSIPQGLTAVGNLLFFAASDSRGYREIYKTDGTPGGTERVKEIHAGRGSNPKPLASLGGCLLFSATDEVHGTELWASDGTGAGTVLLKDLVAGISGPTFGQVSVAGGIGYFNVTIDGQAALWRTDGTPDGTFSIQNASFAAPSSFIASGSSIYFVAGPTEGDLSRRTLWKSDGTVAGTVQVSDKLLNTGGHQPAMASRDGVLYFSLGGLYETVEIWKTSGGAPTRVIPNLREAKELRVVDFGQSRHSLVFRGSDGLSGLELWISDGTMGGTGLLKDLYPGPQASYWERGVESNGLLYFRADNGDGGTRLWRTDGTEAGTILLKKFKHGITSIVPFGNGVVCRAPDDNGYELWRSDGTVEGTRAVTNVNGTVGSNPSFRAVAGDSLFFRAGVSVWNTVGADIREHTQNADMAGGVQIQSQAFGQILVYAGDPPKGQGSNRELWRTDGTAAGTVLVKEIVAAGSSSPAGFYSFGSTAYFFALISGSWELWKTDGSEAGTTKVSSLPTTPGSVNSSFNIRRVGELIYFTTARYSTVKVLWVSDGTAAGTRIVKDLDANGVILGTTETLTYFRHAQKIWRTDGTPSGTFALNDSGAMSALEAPEGQAGFFYYISSGSPTALWRADGTVAGSTKVTELPGRIASPYPSFRMDGDTVFWLEENQIYSLWRTDGTPAGTRAILSLPASHRPGAGVKAGGDYYFLVINPQERPSVWATDGTTAGSGEVLVDFAGLAISSSNLWQAGDYLYLPLDSDAYGDELYLLPLAELKTASDHYRTWAEDSVLAGSGAEWNSSPQRDGIPNLLKYAFFMNGSRPDVQSLAEGGEAGLPASRVTVNPDGRKFRIEFIRRKDRGLVYTPMISTSLTEGSFAPITGTTTVIPIDAERERVIVERPIGTDEARLFGKVKVGW